MDFSDALKALKEGKKVRRKSYGNHHLEIIENVDSRRGYSHSIAVFDGSKMITDYAAMGEEFLANDWEIVKEPPKVPVKTKTMEYITCSKCENDIEIENTWREVHCKQCNNIMEIERKMTIEEAISIFNKKYQNTTTIDLPRLFTHRGV